MLFKRHWPHRFSSEPSGQETTPSHTCDLGMHIPSLMHLYWSHWHFHSANCVEKYRKNCSYNFAHELSQQIPAENYAQLQHDACTLIFNELSRQHWETSASLVILRYYVIDLNSDSLSVNLLGLMNHWIMQFVDLGLFITSHSSTQHPVHGTSVCNTLCGSERSARRLSPEPAGAKCQSQRWESR
jgi:hypothetical protein